MTTSTFSWRGTGTAAVNLSLCVLFAVFAYAHLLRFIEAPRLSLLLIVVVEMLIAVLLVARQDPDRTQHGWKTWAATTFGTMLPLLLRPTEAPDDLLIGQGIQVAGFCLQIGAILSLNRSFGLLPAHRGVKSDGLYRWMRHPLYSAYLLAHLGYLVNNFSLYNALVLVIATGFQVVRLLQEETLLLEYDAYRDYAERTRWRLIPALW